MGRDARRNIAANKSKTGRGFPLKVALIVGVVAAVGSYVGLMLDSRAGHVVMLDNAMPETLKDTFFGGNPWLMQCVNETVPVHSAAVVAAKQLAGYGIRAGALSCFEPLPSGKNFFQRFGFHDRELPGKNAPLFFVFANGDAPVRPRATDIANVTTIVNWVVSASQPKVQSINSDKDFAKHCLRRKACVLVVGKGAKETPEWLSALAQKHRTVRIASVDTEKTTLSFASELKLSDGEQQLVVLRSLLTDDDIKAAKKAALNKDKKKKKKGDDPKPYGALVSTFDESSVKAAIDTHVNAGTGTGEGWVKLINPTARGARTRSDDTAASRARRRERERAKERAAQQKAGRKKAKEEEEKDVSDELELEDDEVRVSDEEEDEEDGGLI